MLEFCTDLLMLAGVSYLIYRIVKYPKPRRRQNRP